MSDEIADDPAHYSAEYTDEEFKIRKAIAYEKSGIAADIIIEAFKDVPLQTAEMESAYERTLVALGDLRELIVKHKKP